MTTMLAFDHAEQQKAAERIHELMAQGMSSGEAIMKVANEIRARQAELDNQGSEND